MKIADRVSEDTTTTGTGSYSLGGAQVGFRTFSSAFSTGDTVYYCCEDGTDWEVGQGTLTTGTPWTLSRTTILASSNAGAAVNWSAGTKNLFCTSPAGQVAGAAKAWVNFNGTASGDLRRASFNVSSITDHGAGEYTANFASAMPDENYAVVFGSSPGNGRHPYIKMVSFNDTTGGTTAQAYSTTAVRVSMQTNAGSFADCMYFNMAVFR